MARSQEEHDRIWSRLVKNHGNRPFTCDWCNSVDTLRLADTPEDASPAAKIELVCSHCGYIRLFDPVLGAVMY